MKKMTNASTFFSKIAPGICFSVIRELEDRRANNDRGALSREKIATLRSNVIKNLVTLISNNQISLGDIEEGFHDDVMKKLQERGVEIPREKRDIGEDQSVAVETSQVAPATGEDPDPIISGGDAYSTTEEKLRQKVIEEYLDKCQGNDPTVALPPLTLPFVIGNEESTVSCECSNNTLVSKKQATPKYLEDFFEQTGVKVKEHGRTIVNMSGEENLCGYRAILSQIDRTCAGTALARPDIKYGNSFFPGEGGTKSMAQSTIEKACMLRLAVALDQIREENMSITKELLSEKLSEKMKKLSKDFVGSLENTHVRHLSKALGRKIAVIEKRMELDPISKVLRPSPDGALLEIYDENGVESLYGQILQKEGGVGLLKGEVGHCTRGERRPHPHDER